MYLIIDEFNYAYQTEKLSEDIFTNLADGILSIYTISEEGKFVEVVDKDFEEEIDTV
jgi:hypothetical protein